MRVELTIRDPRAALAAAQAGLLAVGLLALGAFGWLKFEEIHGQRQLQAEFNRQLQSAPRMPAAAGKTPSRESRPARTPTPEAGTAAHVPPIQAPIVGRLTAERIGLNVVVVDGTDAEALRSAAGRLPNNVQPGDAGNLAIAAHRDTYFEPLRGVQAGDRFALETTGGAFHYEVEWFAVVEPSNVSSIQPTDEAVLTLITCFPFDYVGSAPRRFIVRARQVDPASP